MNIENIRAFCKNLPSVTEDIKWGHDLCFSVGGKMFCVVALEPPLKASFKVFQEEFQELVNSDGIVSAPYVGRYHWVLVEKANRFTRKEWENYLGQSYELVKARLPRRVVIKLAGEEQKKVRR